MFRIISWLTATLAVVAIITYYQVNLSGEGERGHSSAAAADCGGARTPTSAEQATAADAPPAGSTKADDPCANSDHSGKPDE